MAWAQRLRRLFDIDVANSAGQPIGTAAGCREAVGCRDVADETCRACGGALRVIACIEDPVVIEKILSHLDKKTSFVDTNRLPETRASPQRGLFD